MRYVLLKRLNYQHYNLHRTIPSIFDEFGDLEDYTFSGNETIGFATLGSGTSGSVPFNANAIELVSAGGEEPFMVSYSLRAIPNQVETVNNLTSLCSV